MGANSHKPLAEGLRRAESQAECDQEGNMGWT
jgi:hypothetical protein